MPVRHYARRVIYFQWKNRYWTCSKGTWRTLKELVSSGKPFEIEELVVKPLREKPQGSVVYNLAQEAQTYSPR